MDIELFQKLCAQTHTPDGKLIIEAITHLYKSVQTDFSAKLTEQDNKIDSNTKEIFDLKAQILA